jgi:hypothetical protein
MIGHIAGDTDSVPRARHTQSQPNKKRVPGVDASQDALCVIEAHHERKSPHPGEWGEMKIKLASEEEAKRYVSSTRATPEVRVAQKTFPEMGQARGRL